MEQNRTDQNTFTGEQSEMFKVSSLKVLYQFNTAGVLEVVGFRVSGSNVRFLNHLKNHC